MATVFIVLYQLDWKNFTNPLGVKCSVFYELVFELASELRDSENSISH